MVDMYHKYHSVIEAEVFECFLVFHSLRKEAGRECYT